MKGKSSEYKLLSGLFFRLLPYQILLLIIVAVNGIVDSLYASNMIGKSAMSAIGLFSPLNHFLYAASNMLVSGSAGNVVQHGFSLDRKQHSADIRVIHKEDEVILRIRDNCAAFDPSEYHRSMQPDGSGKNVGIQIVYGIAKEVNYQNLLGMNVLTMRI